MFWPGSMRPDNQCTLWPDGWPVWLGGTGREWLHCCIEHDHGGGDLELAQCVAGDGGLVMALVMLAGLTLAWPLRLWWRRKR